MEIAAKAREATLSPKFKNFPSYYMAKRPEVCLITVVCFPGALGAALLDGGRFALTAGWRLCFVFPFFLDSLM